MKLSCVCSPSEETKTPEINPCDRSTASGQLCLLPSAVNLTLAWGECASFCRQHWRRMVTQLIEMIMGASLLTYPSGVKLEAKRVIFTTKDETLMAEWDKEEGAIFYPGFNGPNVPHGPRLLIPLTRFIEFTQQWTWPEVVFIVFELQTTQNVPINAEIIANWQGKTITLLGEQSRAGENIVLLRYGVVVK